MVTIGTKPDCQPCKLTKMRLTKQGIPFTEVPVTELMDVAAEHNLTSAPIVIAPDGRVWGGYRPDELDKLA
jgi:glutaredoxin-like protein NrdH